MKDFIAKFGPGLLVAATGVGAGDLATSALAGAETGTFVVIAVVVGGLFKFILNEGLARWQLETGTTLIEGVFGKLNKGVRYVFLVYLVLWSFTVAAAIMSACGIAAHAIWPVFDDADTAKIVFGIGLSATGYVLIRLGGFKLFEKIMSLAIVLMISTVLFTVFQIDYDWSAKSMRWPSQSYEWQWFVAVLGGVGGTVTILCYGYWIREQGRIGKSDLRISRVDLVVAYGLTILLGIAMVIVGSQITIEGKGASLLIQLANVLTEASGPFAGWVFRIGAFAAIFSSLLGVWQSVPYLFADILTLGKQDQSKVSLQETKIYKQYLFFLAVIPAVGLWWGFSKIQMLYAICGAMFIPMLAAGLIYFAMVLKSQTFNIWSKLAYFVVFVFFISLLIIAVT